MQAKDPIHMKNNKKKNNSIKASRVAASAADGAVPAGDPSSSGGVGVYSSSRRSCSAMGYFQVLYPALGWSASVTDIFWST